MDVAAKYELLDQIGSGGMATVHRARQRGIAGFDRIVAIKQIHEHLVSESGFVDRFIREARIVSALAHANIVQIYDFGRSDAGHYIAMEYLEGWPLFRIVAAAASAGVQLPVPVVLSLLYELCDALDHVHTRRGRDGEPLDIVHRDISLGNLFVARSGHLKLIDFGIASAEGLVPDKDNEVAGKPSYMAPETIRGQPIDARADVFAIGVVAWELLAAARLFGGKDDRATMREVLRTNVEPPSRRRADCPPILDTLVLGALIKDPRKRPSSAAVVRDRIEAVARACGVELRAAIVKRWLRDSGLLASLGADEASRAQPPTTPDRPLRGPTPVAWQAASAPAPMPRVRVISWLRVIAVAAAVAVAPIAVAIRSDAQHTPVEETIVMTSRHVSIEPIAAPAPVVVTAPVAAHDVPARVRPPTRHATARPQPAHVTVEAVTAAPAAMPVEIVALPPPVPLPPPVAPAPAAPTIPPDRVSLVAGKIARIDRRKLDQESIAHRISAVLCIDDRGAVSSVKLLRAVPDWLSDELLRDLRAFRFTPYRVNGAPTPACFVRQLAID